MIEALGGESFDNSTREKLAQLVSGNPLLTVRFTRHLLSLPPEASIDPFDATHSEGDMIEALTAPLSANAKRLLTIASVAGGDLPAPLLQSVSGLSHDAFNATLAELIGARLFKRLPTRSDDRPEQGEALQRLDVYHDRIREVIYRRLDESTRRQHHQELAVTLESRVVALPREIEALLHHWSEAGNRDKRRELALKAAEIAISKLAFRRAVLLLRAVLEDPDPNEPLVVTAKRWERVGRLCEYRGDLGEAGDAHQRAIALWQRTDGDDDECKTACLRLYGRVGENLITSGQFYEGQEACANGLALMDLPLQRSVPRQILRLAWLRIRLLLFFLIPKRWRRRTPTPWRLEQLQFFGLAVRTLGIWPLWGIEFMMRGEMLGRQLNDKVTQFRGLVHQILFLNITGQFTPRAIARAHRTLDQAEALVHEHEIPLGLEVVRVYRSTLHRAKNLDRAQRLLEDAQDALARRGYAGGYDSNIAKTFLFLILSRKGDAQALSQQFTDTQALRQLHVLSEITGRSYLVASLVSIGAITEAEIMLGHLDRLMKDKLLSILSHLHALAHTVIDLAKGRFEEVLEAGAECFRVATRTGTPISGNLRSAFFQTLLDAALGLQQQGALSASQNSQALRRARWLSRRVGQGDSCLGHRALALFAHQRGNQTAARRALALALEDSSANANPRHRWLCLDTARELNALNDTLNAEYVALEESVGRPTISVS